MLVRRVHLYSGLFMFPFVLLYGVSGWLFNHPRSFSGDAVRSVQLGTDDASALPTASQWASWVTERLDEQSSAAGGPPVQVDATNPARFVGFPSFSVTDDNGTHGITIHPVTGRAQIRTTEPDDEQDADKKEMENPLLEIESVDLTDDPYDKLRDDLKRQLETVGIEADAIKDGRRTGVVEFDVLAGETPLRVRYGISNGTIRSSPAEERNDMKVKSFLQRLHLTRTYSPQVDTRWIWGFVVDVMVVSMVFWGISGLIMWWQVKRTRLWGLLTVALSVIFTIGMGAAMHDELTKPSLRRSTGTNPTKGPSSASEKSEETSTGAKPTITPS